MPSVIAYRPFHHVPNFICQREGNNVEVIAGIISVRVGTAEPSSKGQCVQRSLRAGLKSAGVGKVRISVSCRKGAWTRAAS